MFRRALACVFLLLLTCGQTTAVRRSRRLLRKGHASLNTLNLRCDMAQPVTQRRDCAKKFPQVQSWNQAICQAKGCCWSPAKPGQPWCFEKTPPRLPARCDMAQPVTQRRDCAKKFPQVQSWNQAICQAKGCCWSPAKPGQPWCFEKSRSDGHGHGVSSQVFRILSSGASAPGGAGGMGSNKVNTYVGGMPQCTSVLSDRSDVTADDKVVTPLSSPGARAPMSTDPANAEDMRPYDQLPNPVTAVSPSSKDCRVRHCDFQAVRDKYALKDDSSWVTLPLTLHMVYRVPDPAAAPTTCKVSGDDIRQSRLVEYINTRVNDLFKQARIKFIPQVQLHADAGKTVRDCGSSCPNERTAAPLIGGDAFNASGDGITALRNYAPGVHMFLVPGLNVAVPPSFVKRADNDAYLGLGFSYRDYNELHRELQEASWPPRTTAVKNIDAVAHEIGHALGLLHTFAGAANATVGHGSKCHCADTPDNDASVDQNAVGDFCKDTTMVFQYYVNVGNWVKKPASACSQSPSRDCNAYYATGSPRRVEIDLCRTTDSEWPEPNDETLRNIMSYNSLHRVFFTQNQIARMRCYIANSYMNQSPFIPGRPDPPADPPRVVLNPIAGSGNTGTDPNQGQTNNPTNGGTSGGTDSSSTSSAAGADVVSAPAERTITGVYGAMKHDNVTVIVRYGNSDKIGLKLTLGPNIEWWKMAKLMANGRVCEIQREISWNKLNPVRTDALLKQSEVMADEDFKLEIWKKVSLFQVPWHIGTLTASMLKDPHGRPIKAIEVIWNTD